MHNTDVDSLVSRPFPPPVFDRILYAKTIKNWRWERPGNKARKWTRGQKLALIGTVCVCVRTLILRSVAATKTGQAPAESHVKRMNC